MTIKEKLEEIKNVNNSKFREILIDYYLKLKDNEIKLSMEEVIKYGYSEGNLSELIYYNDTNKLYDEYKSEINKYITELMEITKSKSIFELIPTLDTDDMLLQTSSNKQKLICFGIEEINHKLYSQMFDHDIVYDVEKNNKIKVLFKEPGKKFKTLEIDNTLEAKQKLVGGLIEIVQYNKDTTFICNEEGKLKNLSPNILFNDDYIVGDFFMVGYNIETGDFKSLKKEELIRYKKELKQYEVECKNDNEIECEM